MEVITALHELLFSAHAEVFHRIGSGAPGGDRSSPRTRRYFPVLPEIANTLELFSAHAEVFPWHPSVRVRRDSLLRARGGISQ